MTLQKYKFASMTVHQLILLSGEFGVVYKANLQWQLDAATEVVAVKTLKGIRF